MSVNQTAQEYVQYSAEVSGQVSEVGRLRREKKRSRNKM